MERRDRRHRTRGPGLLGAIAAALTDVVIRDAVLTSLIPDVDPDLPAQALRAIMDAPAGVRPGPEAAAAEHLLEDVAAHAATTRTAAPTTLLVLLARWSGDGARAGVLLRPGTDQRPEPPPRPAPAGRPERRTRPRLDPPHHLTGPARSPHPG